MKKIKFLSITLLSAISFFACSHDNESNTKNDNETVVMSSLSTTDSSNSVKNFAKAYYKLYTFIGDNPAFFEDFQPQNYQFNNDHEFINYAAANNFNNLILIQELVNDYPITHENFKNVVELEMQEAGITDMRQTPSFQLFKNEVEKLQVENLVTTFGSKKECLEDWQNGRQDCNEDAIVNSGFSILAAAGGIWPGVVAAAATMYTYNRCISRNDRDYKLCIQRG